MQKPQQGINTFTQAPGRVWPVKWQALMHDVYTNNWIKLSRSDPPPPPNMVQMFLKVLQSGSKNAVRMKLNLATDTNEAGVL